MMFDQCWVCMGMGSISSDRDCPNCLATGIEPPISKDTAAVMEARAAAALEAAVKALETAV